MERIQSAIQKAREARQQSTGTLKRVDETTSSRTFQKQIDGAPNLIDPTDQLWKGLAEVEPDHKRLGRARIFSDRVSELSSPFDALRTRMMHQMNANDWRRIAITSPGPECGKSTLCMNLAFSFARQRDIRSMVIDLDMRRPSIGKLLGRSGGHQFADALERQSAPEDHMVCYERKLAFAINSEPGQNPAELLQEKTAAHVIDEIDESYKPDVMLFDTPPMLACDDTYAFLDQIDCVLLVAAAESSTADELEKCKQDIEARCNFMGVILNKCRYLDKSDSYGY